MFSVSQEYSKKDIYKLLDVPEKSQKGTWDTGYRSYNGGIYIFTNIGIAGRTGGNLQKGCTCYICRFDFEKTYRIIGKGFIHIHHLKQLSEINEEHVVNPETDLVPVCPNCHSMLHKKTPPFSILELKALMEYE